MNEQLQFLNQMNSEKFLLNINDCVFQPVPNYLRFSFIILFLLNWIQQQFRDYKKIFKQENMTIQLCNQHYQPKDYICAKNQCCELFCKQCFKVHSETVMHYQAVKLSVESKQFFIRWSEFILKKIVSFEDIVTHMGYSKIFEMKLEPNHPKGTFSQINFQDIQKVAVQALEEHKKVTEGNLFFIKGTKSVPEMILPEFIKDLYNIACEDTKFNLTSLLLNFSRKLIESNPEKEIYKYAKFNITPKQIMQIQNQRKRLLREYDEKIMLRAGNKKDSPAKSGISSPKREQNLPSDSQNQNNFSMYKDYNTMSQKQLSSFAIDKKQQQRSDNLQNASTRTIPSPTIKDVEYTRRQVPQSSRSPQKKPSYEQLTTAISLLRSNELMYQQRIIKLEHQNAIIKLQVERLSKVEQKSIELQKQMQKLARPQENVKVQLQRQLQEPFRKQIQQLQKVQQNLIQENKKVNHALKDLEDIAEGRSRTILQLQEQIKTLIDNLQLKQKSIQQLNQLISNEEEIAYRENEVQILQQEIKKKLDKIAFLEKSIHELNNLIANEEEQIAYRENETQTLQQEVKKLLDRNAFLQKAKSQLNNLIQNEEQEITYRQNQTENLQKEIQKLQQKISTLEKTIHELNNLIANEEEEIAYKENQSETLAKQVSNLIEKNKQLENQLRQSSNVENQLEQSTESLQAETSLLIEKNHLLNDQIKLLKEKYSFAQRELEENVKQNTAKEIEAASLRKNYSLLQTEFNIVKSELVSVKADLNITTEELSQLRKKTHSPSTQKQVQAEQQFDDQLLQQIVVLQSQLNEKNQDIDILVVVTQDCLRKALAKELLDSEAILNKLKSLKTINLQNVN